MTTPHYVLGIDIGQANDPTALALIEHTLDHKPTYHLRALHRFPLGTPYPRLVEQITRRLDEKPLAGQTRTAIDSTGVGSPVVDLFKEHKQHAPFIYAITITGGTSVGGSGGQRTVPKRDLITTTAVLLQQGRLRIAANLTDADTLVDELLSYRIKLSDTGHDSYGPANSNEHDDLLLALCLALWLAENKPPSRPGSVSVPTGRIPIHTNPDYYRYR